MSRKQPARRLGLVDTSSLDRGVDSPASFMPQNIPAWPNCLQPQTFSEPRSGLVRDFRYLQNNANLTPTRNQKSIITCLATQWPVALTDCLNQLKQTMISYMEVIALQSGSSGNCIYVEAGGMRLLFDAGISGIQAESRLADHGRDIRDIDALIIPMITAIMRWEWESINASMACPFTSHGQP